MQLFSTVLNKQYALWNGMQCVAYLLLHCLYKMCVNHAFDHLIFLALILKICLIVCRFQTKIFYLCIYILPLCKNIYKETHEKYYKLIQYTNFFSIMSEHFTNLFPLMQCMGQTSSKQIFFLTVASNFA